MHGPDVFEDGLARHRLAGVPNQVRQQVALHLRQLVLAIAGVQLQRVQVQRVAAERQQARRVRLPRLFARPAAAPQQPAHARQQDGQLERLRQVVVGAGLEAFQHVFGPPPRGQHQHRHELAGLAQRPHHAEAVAPGQHHVENHRGVGRAVAEQPRQRVVAVTVHVHLVSISFEIEAQPLRDVIFVFDDEDAAHRGTGLGGVICAVTFGLAFKRGSSSVKVAPVPSPSLCAKTRPPCCLAMVRTMNNPRPVPLTL